MTAAPACGLLNRREVANSINHNNTLMSQGSPAKCTKPFIVLSHLLSRGDKNRISFDHYANISIQALRSPSLFLLSVIPKPGDHLPRSHLRVFQCPNTIYSGPLFSHINAVGWRGHTTGFGHPTTYTRIQGPEASSSRLRYVASGSHP